MIVALLAAAALSPLDAAIKASVARCTPGARDEIVVCADRDPLPSPYRLPLPVELEAGDPRARSISRERNDLLDHDAGGTGSCSAVGAGGQYGCGFRAHKNWVLQRAGARDPRGPAYDK